MGTDCRLFVVCVFWLSPRFCGGDLLFFRFFPCLLFVAYCLPSGSSPGSLGFFCFFRFLQRSTSLRRSSGDMSSAGSLCFFCFIRLLQRSTSLRRSSGAISSGSGSSLVTSSGSSSGSDSFSGTVSGFLGTQVRFFYHLLVLLY